jgi:hypothetical protein|tara:strand:- start:1481 stop:1630 length:150 start_codon:yes stop_codon:yes gene_type:complete
VEVCLVADVEIYFLNFCIKYFYRAQKGAGEQAKASTREQTTLLHKGRNG